MLRSIFSKPYSYLFGLIFFIFLISANFAWLNPPAPYVIKTSEKIPLLWQYNGDAAVEFLSGAYFPDYFHIDKTRINRPAYPALVRLIGSIYGAIAYPVHKLNNLQKGLLGYVTLKLLVYTLGILAFFSLVKRYFGERVGLAASALLFLHPFAVTFIGTFHTSELEFLTPIFLVYMWFELRDAYSMKKNILFSLITGVLMLAKENYAAYLAILLYSFFIAKKYKESVLSFIIHLLPLGLWLISLKLLHLSYYNHETDAGLGVNFFGVILSGHIALIAKTIVTGVTNWLTAGMTFFNLSFIGALLAFSLPQVRERVKKPEIIFALILIAMSAIQTVVAWRFNTYMTADLALIIFPFAAMSLLALFDRFRLTRFLPIFFGVYFVIGLLTVLGLPWVSPYHQKGITHPDRVEALKQGL